MSATRSELEYVLITPARNEERFVRRALDSMVVQTHLPLRWVVVYKPLGHTASDFSESLKVSSEILSLPIFPELTDDQVQHVADEIASAATE